MDVPRQPCGGARKSVILLQQCTGIAQGVLNFSKEAALRFSLRKLTRGYEAVRRFQEDQFRVDS